MAQQDKLTYAGTFNNTTSGLFKDNTSGDIEAVDHRLQVTNTADSVPFTLDDSYTWAFPQVTASGTDTYTATLSPAITAYAIPQKFTILFTNANTGAATLALNGLAALAITKNGATALSAGDIAAGSIKILAYDGTRLQIVGDGAAGSPAASETTAGIAELATQAETNTGTDDARIVTPLKLANATQVTNKQLLVNAATALVDAASMDLTAIKHTLTTSSATRTFTISYTGDDISMRVVLNTTSSVFTFPAGALCVNSDGSASGDNTCSLAGTSGDVYVFAIKNWGSSVYTVVCKNTLQ